MIDREYAYAKNLVKMLTDPHPNHFLIDQFLTRVGAEYPRSSLLLFYRGHYIWKQVQNLANAKLVFKMSIDANPLFVQPYFALLDILVSENETEAAIELIAGIYEKKVIEEIGQRPTRIAWVDTRIKDALIMLNLTKTHRRADALKYAMSMMDRPPGKTQDELQARKRACLAINAILLEPVVEKSPRDAPRVTFDPDRALEYVTKGLSEIPRNGNRDYEKLDRELYHSFLSTRFYVEGRPLPCRFSFRELSLPPIPRSIRVPDGSRTRIGYLCGNASNNAEGLFLTPLFRYHDRTKYEVFLISTLVAGTRNSFHNMFREMFDLNHFRDISGETDANADGVISSMEIDVLFDITCHGAGNRADLVARKPAPVIVNYMGYPGTYDNTDAVEYRVGDRWADPSGKEFSEIVLRMPRCFLCFHKFDIISMPDLVDRRAGKADFGDEIRIGVFNRSSKHSLRIRNAWKRILGANARITLVVKESVVGQHAEERFADFPPGRVVFLPFTRDQEDYYDMFNSVDACVDTFPYSGTATTCSAFFMGIPTYTIYSGMRDHVSNVSASIIKAVGGRDHLICGDEDEYVAKVAAISSRIAMEERIDTRARFLEAMEPNRFMREFEGNVIEKVNPRNKPSLPQLLSNE